MKNIIVKNCVDLMLGYNIALLWSEYGLNIIQNSYSVNNIY